MSLEQDLRRALSRKEPPAGFDDRVLARVRDHETVRMPPVRRHWTRASLPIAASLMLALGGTYYLQQQRAARDAQAHTEQTAREVVLALQIASETVSAAQAKVQEISRYEPTNNR